MPAPIDKIKNRYRWRMIIKCKLNMKLIEDLHKCIDNIEYKDTRIIVDINPNNMM